MRPAVYASVLRNRKPGSRRVPQGPHKFSWRRCCVMVFVAAVLLIPGLVVTILGLVDTETVTNIPGDRVLYKVLGPAALACGAGILCSSGIYYCCWGLKSPVTRPSSKHYKKDHHCEEQSDPLNKLTSAGTHHSSHPGDHGHISSSGEGVNGASRSSPIAWRTDTPTIRHSGGGYDSPSLRHSTGYDSPSVRHNSNQIHHSHSHHSHRASSRSLDERSPKGHHNNHSRLRSCSSSSAHRHSSHSHQHTPSPDNQVTFQKIDAPIAAGEASGSGEISIDIGQR